MSNEVSDLETKNLKQRLLGNIVHLLDLNFLTTLFCFLFQMFDQQIQFKLHNIIRIKLIVFSLVFK